MTPDLTNSWYELLRMVSDDIEYSKVRIAKLVEPSNVEEAAGRGIFLKGNKKAQIRRASEGDLSGICDLIAALGYPRDEGVILRRLLALSKSADDLVLVVVSDKELLGWMQISDRETLEGGKRIEIVGLVVAARARRTGVASALIREAARIASHRGRDVVVRTNIVREEARAFYESVGFKETKIQRVFVAGPESLFQKRDRFPLSND